MNKQLGIPVGVNGSINMKEIKDVNGNLVSRETELFIKTNLARYKCVLSLEKKTIKALDDLQTVLYTFEFEEGDDMEHDYNIANEEEE